MNGGGSLCVCVVLVRVMVMVVTLPRNLSSCICMYVQQHQGYLFKARRHGLNVRQYWLQVRLELAGSELVIYRNRANATAPHANGVVNGIAVSSAVTGAHESGDGWGSDSEKGGQPKKEVVILELGPGCRLDDTGLVRYGGRELFTFCLYDRSVQHDRTHNNKRHRFGATSPEEAAQWIDVLGKAILEGTTTSTSKAAAAALPPYRTTSPGSHEKPGSAVATGERSAPIAKASTTGRRRGRNGNAPTTSAKANEKSTPERRRSAQVRIAPPQMDANETGRVQKRPSTHYSLHRTSSTGEVPVEMHEIAGQILQSNNDHSRGIIGAGGRAEPALSALAESLGSAQAGQGGADWRLLGVENGMRLFEERSYLSGGDDVPVSGGGVKTGKSVRAVCVVNAPPDIVFRLVMNYELNVRGEWDSVHESGEVLETIDGHTDVVREQLRSMPLLGGAGSELMSAGPREMTMMRYWRRDADGSYVVMYRSTDHRSAKDDGASSGPRPREADMVGGAFIISPLRRGGSSIRGESVVAHWLEMDPRGWTSFLGLRRAYTLKVLTRLAGLREFIDQTRVVNMRHMLPSYVQQDAHVVSGGGDRGAGGGSVLPKAGRRGTRGSVVGDGFADDGGHGSTAQPSNLAGNGGRRWSSPSVDSTSMHARFDEATGASFEDEEEARYIASLRERCSGSVDFGESDSFSGSTLRNCWIEPRASTFNIRSRSYLWSKVKEPSVPSHMHLVAVDWLRCSEKITGVAEHPDHPVQRALLHEDRVEYIMVFNMQAPASQHYSLVLYYVSLHPIDPGTLLGRFIDGPSDFRDARLKLLPNIATGPWIVQRGVGRTPLIVGSALKVRYSRRDRYFVADIDIGTSSVACGITRFVIGYVRHLVIDMGLVVQGNCEEELPERLLGQVRIVHLELKSAAEYVPPRESRSPSPGATPRYNDKYSQSGESDGENDKKTI